MSSRGAPKSIATARQQASKLKKEIDELSSMFGNMSASKENKDAIKRAEKAAKKAAEKAAKKALDEVIAKAKKERRERLKQLRAETDILSNSFADVKIGGKKKKSKKSSKRS